MSQIPSKEIDRQLATPATVLVQGTQFPERLLNAREVAERLGVSERFIRDHTTRRLPRIPGVRLGKLIRYRVADVDLFISELHNQTSSHRSLYRV
ncbi:MAG: helix-turn-helix domain-containing protein [Acidobacteriaceae bacterium]|jgi:excisionase family DNA binding protein